MLEIEFFDPRESSERIITLRTQRGLTQEELAAELGISLQTIKNYEKTGSKNIKDPASNARINAISGMKIETLFKMAKFFNVSADYILGISPIRSQDATVKGIAQTLGIQELHVDFLIAMKNLVEISNTPPDERTKMQSTIIDLVCNQYPMVEDKFEFVSEEFKSYLAAILDVVFDRSISHLFTFLLSRTALLNQGSLDNISKHEWQQATNILTEAGYLPMQNEDAVEYYLSKIADSFKTEMRENIMRFGYDSTDIS